MADDIYINTGSEFQQPYQGQITVNGQEPNIRQISKQAVRNAQQPFTYNNRQPFTYQNIVAAQEPNIRDKQSPFTYQRTGQNPFTYRHPFTYQNNARQPVIYQVQSPFTYRNPVNAQEPNIRDKQNPYPYPANIQQPYPYIAQGRNPIIGGVQEPNIRSKQESNPSNTQQPVPVNYRQPSIGPYIAQGQQPVIYQTNPAYIPFGGWQGGEPDPWWASRRSPFTYNAQGNIQQPNIGQGGFYQSQYQQVTYTQNPSPFQFSGRTPTWHQQPIYGNEREPLLLRTPVSNQPTQQPNPTAVQNNTPVIAFQPFTNQVQSQAQSPYTYDHRSPFIGPIQQPFTYQRTGQSPYTYQATGRTPLTYQHQSPFTYRNPVSAQENNAKNKQSPFTYPANAQQPSNAQQPYPYIANARQPIIYDHRSPFTYPNPVNAQQPYIAQGRNPSSYQFAYQLAYDHRSPFTYQQNYQTTRPIGPLAKVKGVFVNNPSSPTGDNISKVQQVYVHDATGQSAEKTHQAVPTAQYSKT